MRIFISLFGVLFFCDAFSRQQGCENGWSGLNCDICTEDSVCRESRRCSRSLIMTGKLHSKSCSVNLPPFYKRFLPENTKMSLTMQCNADTALSSWSCNMQSMLPLHLKRSLA